MEQVKPICVMYFPTDFSFGGGGRLIDPLYLMKELNGWSSDMPNPRTGMDDYIWWCFFKQNITEPELQVFHPKDFTPIQFEELKTLVLTELDKLKNNNND